MYIDKCFVINHGDIIAQSAQGYELTEYGKNNLPDVSIEFIDYDDNTKPDTFISGEENGKDIKGNSYLYRYDPNAKNAEVFDRAIALRNVKEDFEDKFASYRTDHLTFSQCAFALMNQRGWDSADFEKYTHLDAKTFSGIKNDKLPPPKLRKVIAICVGLGLSLEQSSALLALAGLTLTDKREHRAYAYILSSFSGAPISECNEILTQLGVRPLGIG
jgi:hypothetical protein